jgi:aldehyde dehydrogenase (NAD(P)+)
MDTGALDQDLSALAKSKDGWAAMSAAERASYLPKLRDAVSAVAEEWVAAAVKAKGIPDGSPLAGEEWLSGPYCVLAWLDAMERTLDTVASGKDVLQGLPVRVLPNGQTAVRVSPYDLKEKLLLHGFSSEVWMEPGVTPANLRDNLAGQYRSPGEGKVALVLGAGNIASIAPLDVLYKLYADGEVAILKMNPVNEYLGPILEKALAPLAADGFVRFAYGAADVGEYLCHHADVDSIHITGSARTHDAIVYGVGADGADRKARDERALDKPVSSELGGVGPTIVVPGPWTDKDIRFQAEHIATQKLHNSGFNCVASQVLVLPSAWDRTDALVDAVENVMRTATARPAYYPGADSRREAATEHAADAVTISTGSGTRALLKDVRDSYAFTEEFFGPVLATTKLPGSSAADFLRAAVRFANEQLDGTLGANIIVHPRTAAELGPVLDEALAELRYGTIAVNVWTAFAYLNPRSSWGAFPGHTYAEIGRAQRAAVRPAAEDCGPGAVPAGAAVAAAG